MRLPLPVTCAVVLSLAAGVAAPESVATPSAVRASGSLQDLPAATLEHLIASATPDAPATVRIANRDIVVLRASLLGRSSADRVAAIRQLLAARIADGGALEVSARPLGDAYIVRVGDRDIFAIVPADANPLLGETAERKATAAVVQLRQALIEIGESRQPRMVAWGIVQALAATLAFGLALAGLARVRRRAWAAVDRATARAPSASGVAQALVRVTHALDYVRYAVTAAAVLGSLSLGYLWLTFVLRRFPYTRPWGDSLRTLLVERAVWFGGEIARVIPGLFTIVVIVLATRFAVRIARWLFAAVEQGRITLPWLYPDTAATTRKLVIGLLWFFAFVLAYPRLPGSGTEAFKGVSVLVGLMVSLGASGIVSQIVSGLTITYARALHVGDFVRVGDVEGTVIHMGALSTKLDTLRHEEVTIPNVQFVTESVTNYTRFADTTGVFIPTSVFIGYDVPWRQVVALLLQAAARTSGVRVDPPPLVRQSALDDSGVRYTLLVCLVHPNARASVLDELHANIQDAFNDQGVQIMTPHYEGDPSTPKLVPRERWFVSPAPGEPGRQDLSGMASEDQRRRPRPRAKNPDAAVKISQPAATELAD